MVDAPKEDSWGVVLVVGVSLVLSADGSVAGVVGPGAALGFSSAWALGALAAFSSASAASNSA